MPARKHHTPRAAGRAILTAHEAERRRIASQLHGEAGQNLASLKLSLDLLYHDLQDAALQARLADAIALTQTTIDMLMALSRQLRPPALAAVGLEVALYALCDTFRRDSPGCALDCQIDTALPAMADVCAISLYRLAQAALSGIGQAGNPAQARLVLRAAKGRVRLRLSARGAWPQAASDFTPSWLAEMADRFVVLGGRCSLQQTPERMVIAGSLPLEGTLDG